MIAARCKGDARRGADRGIRIGLQEPRAAQGEAIDVRRLIIAAAVAGQITIAEVVGHDEDDVGPALLGVSYEGRRSSCNGEAEGPDGG